MTHEWLRGPRQLQFVFLATMLLLAGTLGWLGWRLLQQDQQLSAQRAVDRQETSADLAVAALERRLADVDQDILRLLRASEPPKTASDGALFLKLSEGEIRTWPQGRLLYLPELPPSPPSRAAGNPKAHPTDSAGRPRARGIVRHTVFSCLPRSPLASN